MLRVATAFRQDAAFKRDYYALKSHCVPSCPAETVTPRAATVFRQDTAFRRDYYAVKSHCVPIIASRLACRTRNLGIFKIISMRGEGNGKFRLGRNPLPPTPSLFASIRTQFRLAAVVPVKIHLRAATYASGSNGPDNSPAGTGTGCRLCHWNGIHTPGGVPFKPFFRIPPRFPRRRGSPPRSPRGRGRSSRRLFQT